MHDLKFSSGACKAFIFSYAYNIYIHLTYVSIYIFTNIHHRVWTTILHSNTLNRPCIYIYIYLHLHVYQYSCYKYIYVVIGSIQNDIFIQYFQANSISLIHKTMMMKKNMSIENECIHGRWYIIFSSFFCITRDM